MFFFCSFSFFWKLIFVAVETFLFLPLFCFRSMKILLNLKENNFSNSVVKVTLEKAKHRNSLASHHSNEFTFLFQHFFLDPPRDDVSRRFRCLLFVIKHMSRSVSCRSFFITRLFQRIALNGFNGFLWVNGKCL